MPQTVTYYIQNNMKRIQEIIERNRRHFEKTKKIRGIEQSVFAEICEVDASSSSLAIANKLKCSPNTVNSHKTNIYKKMGVENSEGVFKKVAGYTQRSAVKQRRLKMTTK